MLTKNQKKQFKKETIIDGKLALVVLNMKHDDDCNNGHNTFSMVVDIYEKYGYQGEPTVKLSDGKTAWLSSCGCQHDVVEKVFFEFAHMIKWHLVSTDSPMHYIANSLYYAKEQYLQAARDCAVWPEAELKDFTKENLEKRLPALLENFKKDIEALGFTY